MNFYMFHRGTDFGFMSRVENVLDFWPNFALDVKCGESTSTFRYMIQIEQGIRAAYTVPCFVLISRALCVVPTGKIHTYL